MGIVIKTSNHLLLMQYDYKEAAVFVILIIAL